VSLEKRDWISAAPSAASTALENTQSVPSPKLCTSVPPRAPRTLTSTVLSAARVLLARASSSLTMFVYRTMSANITTARWRGFDGSTERPDPSTEGAGNVTGAGQRRQ
jgi:hypothetical protein